MAILITDMMLKNLKPKDKEYTKREKGGLGIRVLCSGTITFAYFYTIDGKRRFLNLGKYKDKEKNPAGITLAEARNKLEIERGKVTALKEGRSDGSDPVLTRKIAKDKRLLKNQELMESLTISGLISDYIERHAKRFKKMWQDDKRMLEKELSPYGTLKVEDFTKAHVLNVLEKIIGRGSPASANQCLKIMKKMFNWAVEKDILQHTPCTKIKMPAPNSERERYLNDKEIKTFWDKVDNCPVSDDIKRALKLILVTAQRPGEVIGMHTNEIDGKWWTLPSNRTKNKRPHRIYLTNIALELIGKLEVFNIETGETKPTGFIFPSPRKAKKRAIAEHALPSAVRKGMLKIPVLDDSGNPLKDKDGNPITINKIGIGHFTPHDLRRTATTIMASNKVPYEHRERVLNHTQEKLDRIYNLFDYADEKQIAMEIIEQKILNIITNN